MKNVVVPVDFTESSIHTTLIAARLAANLKQATLILFNLIESISAGSDGTPLADDTDARRKITGMAFQNVKVRIQDLEPSLDVSYYEEEGTSLVNSLEKFAQQHQADLIVIGVSEGSDIENFLLGSNAVDIAKRNVCPVVMVPPNAIYKGVSNVLFASDYKDVTHATPTAAIRSLLSDFGSSLQVVHILEPDADRQQISAATASLTEMLIEFRPEFHLLEETDFIQAIGRLVREKGIDLILTVPRTHSFFSNLFSAGRTRKLAYQSPVPVIAVHE